MFDRLARPCSPLRSPGAIASACSLALLAACGSGADYENTPAPAPAGTSLSGSVAVGAPITDGKLRIVDGNGAVVADNVPIAADGRYAAVALTGPAPYRLEACGYAGANYVCVYSVASAAGTANVTPLTTATVVLAAGRDAASSMSGAASGVAASDLDSAQAQLRTAIAGVMASAGVPTTFDFTTGSLDAGSRQAYDKLLDALGVKLGNDGQPFVQIVPRLGTGNVFLQQGTSSGALATSGAAAALDLSGLETLMADMSASLASSAACSADATGLRRSLASNARMNFGREATVGRDGVASALCEFFGSGDDGQTALWGSRLVSPTLGRCDLSGANPLCGVSFVLRSPDGQVKPVGSGMGVVREGSAWKFYGDLLPIGIRADARAQRTKRVDTPNPVYDYDRAIAFDIAAASGLACARVAQRDMSGGLVPLAYFKRHAGAMNQERLALWTADGFSQGASLDPMVGFTRSADDTWLALPQGAEGDGVIRNFYRGGRNIVVSLYADAACSMDFAVEGRSSFEVEVEGVPPVWASMPGLPWPELDAATVASLSSVSLAAGASGTFVAAWTFPNGPLGVDGATLCGSRADCGQGGTGRLGEKDLRPGAIQATLTLANRGNAVGAGDGKTLALYGRNGEGVGMQSNFSVCPGGAGGDSCR